MQAKKFRTRACSLQPKNQEKGFGRGIYTVLRDSDVEKYRERLEEYERIFGFDTRCYEVKPARGVHLI